MPIQFIIILSLPNNVSNDACSNTIFYMTLIYIEFIVVAILNHFSFRRINLVRFGREVFKTGTIPEFEFKPDLNNIHDLHNYRRVHDNKKLTHFTLENEEKQFTLELSPESQENIYQEETNHISSSCDVQQQKIEHLELKDTVTELSNLDKWLDEFQNADLLAPNHDHLQNIPYAEQVFEYLAQRGEDDKTFEIIRNLAMICTEKQYWNRAIKYHNIILKHMKDNYWNLNEFVYLSQQCSEIYLQINNFHQSEYQLQNAIKTIYYKTVSNTKIEQYPNNISIENLFQHCQNEARRSVVSLTLVLANLYICGGQYLNQAIGILEYLSTHVSIRKTAKRVLILFHLARAYFQHGRYHIANSIIEEKILSKYNAKNNTLLESVEFLELRVQIMMHCNRFKDALNLVEDTLIYMPKDAAAVKKAKLYYLKGQLLQAECFDTLNTQRIKLKKNIDRAKKSKSAKRASKIIITRSLEGPNFTNKTKLKELEETKEKEQKESTVIKIDIDEYRIKLLDAVSALSLSQNIYINKCNDFSMQAKCCLQLVKTYLEIIMEYYVVPSVVLKDEQFVLLPWLDARQHLEKINTQVYNTLNSIVKQIKDPRLLTETYIALAEFEFLKSHDSILKSNERQNQNVTWLQTSKNFWLQAKVTFFGSYKDSNDWIFLRRINRHFRLEIFKLFQRILRLLICYDNKFIADNVDILITYTTLETFMSAQNDIYVKSTESKQFPKYKSTENQEMTQNTTVTLKISDEQRQILEQIQLATDSHSITPLYPRYRDFEQSKNDEMWSEKYLDELFRMHWKISSGIYGQMVDNDKPLDAIISELYVSNKELDVHCTLNRMHRSWKVNETFIISLNNVVFMFHPHTLFKYAIHKTKKKLINLY
eukprot:45909_1